jgi:hypothetical protein
MLKFPKVAPKKKELSVEEYRELIKSNPLALPKNKFKNLLSGNGDTPIKSKSKKAIVPESALQKTCNEMIAAYGFQFIRFEDSFLSWISINAPIHIKKMFFAQVGGKFPDAIIMEPIGDGFFLAAKLELKTEDAKGRAVGELHGKQKRTARAEEWMIARNPRQIENALQTIKNKIILVKNLFKGTAP